MVGFSPYSSFKDTVYYDIEHRNLGGVILMAYNLQNPAQITALTADLQLSATTPLFIATDQEGGVVARLDENNGFTETPTAYHLGTTLDSESSTRATAATMAQWLVQSGINTNLAPVVDVNVNPVSPAIGRLNRSFSADPYKVFDHAAWFASEFHDRNITTALKHFPGHGSALGDSHDGFTDVTATWSDAELTPYREFILEGYAGMIMTGHLYNAQLDSVYPASLSESTVTGLLRDSLGFEGVVITDGMGMGAITNNYGFEEAVVLAINAGTDILLYTTDEHDGVSLTGEIIRIVLENIDSGVIAEERIHESYDRIMTLKAGIGTAIALTGAALPDTYGLHACPNPFNGTTMIRFHVETPAAEIAHLRIYSVQGHRVWQRTMALSGRGDYEIPWNGSAADGTPLSSGTYLYVLQIGECFRSGKMSLLK